MATSVDLTKRSETPQAQMVRSDPLFRWDQLPAAQQRELVLLLASLLLKRLPARLVTREEASDD